MDFEKEIEIYKKCRKKWIFIQEKYCSNIKLNSYNKNISNKILIKLKTNIMENIGPITTRIIICSLLKNTSFQTKINPSHMYIVWIHDLITDVIHNDVNYIGSVVNNRNKTYQDIFKKNYETNLVKYINWCNEIYNNKNIFSHIDIRRNLSKNINKEFGILYRKITLILKIHSSKIDYTQSFLINPSIVVYANSL